MVSILLKLTFYLIISHHHPQLNHAAEPNCEIQFDPQGNCYVTSLYDIAPGSPLTVSYGDPTNPTPLFAKFGFLPMDCATVFCKAVHLESQIAELGYEYKGEFLKKIE